MHKKIKKIQTGMTLIETMVAMAISSFLILGSFQVYTQARSTYRTAESLARLQENLRFSTEIIDEDIKLAGFWGQTTTSANLQGQSNVVVTCDGDNVTDWTIGSDRQNIEPIEALEDAGDLPCPTSLARTNSDVLILRHAESEQNVFATAGKVQVKSNGSAGEFFVDGAEPATASPDGQIFDVAFNAYYISNESKYDANVPSLKRLSLSGDRIVDQEIVPGVENMQIQFGVDTDGDNSIDMYIDSDDPRTATGKVLSVRLWLLVRSEKNEIAQGFKDERIYITPDSDGLTINPATDDGYPQTYRRTALSKTILLRNTS
ncbi:MAG: PilW family protein [Gammaproteobacteria bacterium]|nr:PilW family protein [Gammaproteobacteria bacterium]